MKPTKILDLFSRLTALFRRQEMESDLDEEIQAHLEMAAEEYEARGLSPEEARRAARRDFGGVDQVKKRHREVRGWVWLDHLVRDIRFGARSLLKRPSFTVMAVASLAIGIGANSAIYTLADGTIFREHPFEDADRLVDIYEVQPEYGEMTLSIPNIMDVREGTSHVFSGFAVSTWAPAQVDDTGAGGGPGVTTVLAEVVSGDYFRTLGIDAHIGRTLLPEDDVDAGGHPVVVLGHGYWQDRFAGDPEAVGRELVVGGRSYTIVGVAPPEFQSSMRGMESNFFAPTSMLDEISGSPQRSQRSNHSSFLRARLASGVTFAEAEAALDAVTARLEAERPEGWNPAEYFTMRPTSDVIMFPAYDGFIQAGTYLLIGVVLLVLLLACANLAGFLLARGIDRRREVAMRLALGASRGSLIRQLLTESLLLGLVAGAAGLALAFGSLRILAAADLPMSLPLATHVQMSWGALGFTLMVSLVSGVVLGLLPAFQSTRPDVAGSLRDERSAGGSRRQLRWRNGFVAAQLTFSLVLLVAAGLFLRSFRAIQDVDPGFGQDPSVVFTVMVPVDRFDDEEARVYSDELLDRFSTVPGIEAVGRSDMFPMAGIGRTDIEVLIDGFDPPPGREWHDIPTLTVDDGFFEAAGIPIVRGRGFTDGDGPDDQGVAVISQAMADQYWPDGGAIGQVLRGAGSDAGDEIRIVGVARDIKVYSLREAPQPIVYRNLGQTSRRSAVTFVARTAGNADRALGTLLAEGREADPDLWVFQARTMDRLLAGQRVPTQLSALILSLFGALALILAGIGLYGVVSYAVANRTREVGVRMALGADSPDIVRMLVGNGSRLLIVGGGIGLVLSLVVARLLQSLLFGVGTLDATAFIGAPLALAIVVLLASYLPARRAARLDPVSALRAE